MAPEEPIESAGRMVVSLCLRSAGKRFVAAFALVVTLVGVAGAEVAPSGRDLLARSMAVRLRRDTASTLFRLLLVDAGGGTLVRTVASYRQRCDDGVRQLMVLRTPAEAAGSAFLSWMHGDRLPDAWVWLPELGRPRQLNAATRGESFLGSDLTYEDLGFMALDEREHRLIGTRTTDGEPTWEIESVPKRPDVYGRVVTWLHRDTTLPVRVEYRDPADALLKVGRFGDVRVVQGTPTPFAFSMANVQTGHRTEVTLLEADYDRPIDCERLTLRWLGRAH